MLRFANKGCSFLLIFPSIVAPVHSCNASAYSPTSFPRQLRRAHFISGHLEPPPRPWSVGLSRRSLAERRGLQLVPLCQSTELPSRVELDRTRHAAGPPRGDAVTRSLLAEELRSVEFTSPPPPRPPKDDSRTSSTSRRLSPTVRPASWRSLPSAPIRQGNPSSPGAADGISWTEDTTYAVHAIPFIMNAGERDCRRRCQSLAPGDCSAMSLSVLQRRRISRFADQNTMRGIVLRLTESDGDEGATATETDKRRAILEDETRKENSDNSD